MRQVSHLDVLHPVVHLVHPHVVADHRGLQAVHVCGQQLRPSEALSPDPRGTAVQTQNLSGQAAAGMRPQALLTLAARPRLLLVGRLGLVYGVDVERVHVGVRVAGLRVGDGLVRRREIRGLEVRGGRVRQ